MRQISTRLLARFALLTILGVAIAWGVTPKSASAETKVATGYDGIVTLHA